MVGRKSKSSADFQQELNEALALLGQGGEKKAHDGYRLYEALQHRWRRGGQLTPSDQAKEAASFSLFQTHNLLKKLRSKLKAAQK